MQKSVESADKKGWFARRKDKKEAVAFYERIKEKLDKKLIEEYKELNPEQKKAVREKLADDITWTKAVSDGKRDYTDLIKLLRLAAVTGKVTDWAVDKTDYELTESIIEVFDKSEYIQEGAVISARLAVEALWNNNYYHSEFWETLLEHNDPVINAYVINQFTTTEGGDEILMKNQEKLVAKMGVSEPGRKFLVENFSSLSKETRRQVLGIFSAQGVPMDMSPLISEMVDYPDIKVPAMAWMIAGIKVSATQMVDPKALNTVVRESVEKVKTEIGKALDKIITSVDETSGLVRAVSAGVIKTFKADAKVELGEEELEVLKTIVLSPGDHAKVRSVSGMLLTENETEGAKKLVEETINEGAELFDDADVQKQAMGYDVIRIMIMAGSKYAKEILESMKDEALDDLKDKNASKEQKELALKIVNESAKLLE